MENLLKPERCYLHVIDVQVSLMRQIHGAEDVAKKVKFLLRCAEILGMPVIANTQYKKGLGLYVPEVEELMANIPRPDKVEFNAYANEETAGMVDRLPPDVSSVLLVGVETHICVYQSAAGALARGLKPYIVSDAVSSRKVGYHLEGLERIKELGGVVGSAEMLVYEMLGKAGTDAFKKVLPLIIEQG